MNFESREINIISKVDTLIKDLNIDKPSIAVVGSQGSGKSSVLNNLMNRDILPCGTNLTTRCPIKINLIRTDKKEYADIPQMKCSRVELSNLREELTELMDELTDGEDICGELITINLYLKDTLEFTLIDLPGITRSDHYRSSEDLKEESMEIITSTLSGKNIILLAVIDANEDIDECETLNLCKEIDPKLAWTLGVVTKIDKMDRGTNCLNILNNKVFPLCLGYIGLVNRSQAEIKNNIGVTDFRDIERDFFKNSVYEQFLHDSFSELPEEIENQNKTTVKKDKIGSAYLKIKISEIINLKLRELTIPRIITQVRETINNSKKNSSSLVNIKEKDVKELKNLKMEDIEKIIEKQVSDLKYDYYTVLNNTVTNNNIETIFTMDKTNFIPVLLKNFKVLDVSYDWKDVDEESDNGNSIFVKEDIMRSAIKTNMDIIYKEILGLHNKFIDCVIDKLKTINCVKYPSLAAVFNNKILSEINERDGEIKWLLETFIKVSSTFLSTSEFGDNEYIGEQFKEYFEQQESEEENHKNRRFGYPRFRKNEPKNIEKKQEILKNLCTGYLNKQMDSVLEYALKLNYHYIIDFLKKDALNFILNFNVENSEEIKKENCTIKKHIDDFVELNEAAEMLEKCVIQ